MDYRLLVFFFVFFFSIGEHATRWECSPFPGIRKKSKSRNMKKKKRDEGESPKRSRSWRETCRYRDVTSDRPFFPGYSINISLWTLQRPRPARTKYLKSSSLELPLKYLPSPASLRADRVEAFTTRAHRRGFESVVLHPVGGDRLFLPRALPFVEKSAVARRRLRAENRINRVNVTFFPGLISPEMRN